MTLSELSTLLPPPEGMEWQQRPRAPKDYMLVVVGTGEQVGHVFTDAPLSDANDHPCVVSMTAADRHYREIVAPPDLPSAYLRALAAVGLAPDPEKEAPRQEVADLRRRLTWTEEVPTEVGRYLVEMPMRRACLWTRSDYQPGKPWCSSTSGWCGDDVFPPGTRFLPLANLKET